MRDILFSQGADFLKGDYASIPTWNPIKKSVEDQFKTSQDQILSTLPRGGTLQNALSENIMNKGNQLSGAVGDMYGDMTSLAMGVAPQAMSGSQTLANTASSQGMASNQLAAYKQAQDDQNKLGAVSSASTGIGEIMAGK